MDFNINKEESSRCIAIALDKLASGDREEALRLLEKSLKLFPTTKAQELLDRLRLEIKQKKVHAQNVMRVQRCTSHYEILAIPRGTFSKTLLKKQYKKLALLVHPDKNRAPGAGEAFKLVGNANTILSDPEKKASYDLELELKRLAAQNQNNYYPPEEEEEEKKEKEEDPPKEEQIHTLKQKNMMFLFLPVFQVFIIYLVVLLVVWILPPILLPNTFNPLPRAEVESDLKYSFVQTIECPLEYTTRNLGVKYYLNAHPAALSARAHMEWTVEEKYMKSLRESCAKERFYKEDFLDRARRNMDKNHIIQGRKLATPSCDAYKRAEAILKRNF